MRLRRRPSPTARGHSLQSVGAADGLKEIQSGSSRLVADVLDGDEIRDVDQGLEARELSRQQLVDRGSRQLSPVLEIADASACFDRKWKYIAPLVTSASARMSSRLTKL